MTLRALLLAILAFASPFGWAQAPGGSQQGSQTTSAQANNSSSSSGNSSNNGGAMVATLSAPNGYILSPNDQVAVEVFGEDDLRTAGRLNGEGNLSVPLLGSIRLSGLTLSQAAARLTELYGRDYLVNPKVNVMLVGYAKRRFT